MLITANFQPYQPLAKISACLIVKNESKYIVDCIKSVLPVVDEVVVVDTGSTDNTIELINGIGDSKIHLHQSPWVNNFAYMKNYSMTLSSIKPDYFLIIDGDEILDEEYTKDGPIEFRRRLNLPPKPYNAKAVFLQQRHYTNDTFTVGFERCKGKSKREVGNGYYDSLVIRLFPNKPEIKFQGRIHEVVEFSIKAARIITSRPRTPVMLHHYGNLDSARKDKKKKEHYTKLLEEAIQDDPTNWLHWLELGTEYSNSEKPKEAVNCFKQSLECKLDKTNKHSVDFIQQDFEENINSLYKSLAIAQMKSNDLETERTLQVLYQRTPMDPDVSVYLAMHYMDKNTEQLDEPFQWVNNCLKLKPDHALGLHTLNQLYVASGNTENATKIEKQIEYFGYKK